MSSIRQIIGTLAIAVIVTPLAATLWGNRKKKAIDNLIEQLRKELEITGCKLQGIAVRADKSG